LVQDIKIVQAAIPELLNWDPGNQTGRE